MDNIKWQNLFDGAITVCDENLIIRFMNEKAKEVFKDDGGEKLIGSNLEDCHNENSRKIIRDIKNNLKPNTYTIEKKGKIKIIHQAPLTEEGKFKGIVELSFEIPEKMPYIPRD